MSEKRMSVVIEIPASRDSSTSSLAKSPSPVEEAFTDVPSFLASLANIASVEKGVFDNQVGSFLKCFRNLKTPAFKQIALKMVQKSSRSALASLTDQRVMWPATIWLSRMLSFEEPLSNDLIYEILKVYEVCTPFITIDVMRRDKCARFIRRFVKHEVPKIQQLANKLEAEWVKLLPTAESGKREASPEDIEADKVVKKTKSENKPTSTQAKKQVIAKSVDMSSMFGLSAEPQAAKPKRKVISPIDFTSIESVIKTTLPPLKVKTPTEMYSRASSISSLNKEENKPIKLDKKGRPQKRVTWAPDAMLRKLKVFESDEIDREARKSYMPSAPGFIDKPEGAAMKNTLVEMEPIIDWRIPPLIDIPPDFVAAVTSQAAKEQEERENNVMAVVYFEDAHIPATPTEPEPETVSNNQPKYFPSLDTPHQQPQQMLPVQPVVQNPALINANLLSNLLSTLQPQPVAPTVFSPNLMMRPQAISPFVPVATFVPQFTQFGRPQQYPQQQQQMVQPSKRGHGWPKVKPQNSRGRGR